MRQQLKIIMDYEIEGVDSDGGPLTVGGTVLYINDKAIGCVQDLKLHVNANEIFPQLEITFPNLHNADINHTVSNSDSFVREIDSYIKELSAIPGVELRTQNIDKERKVYVLKEIGTTGSIGVVHLRHRETL